MQPSPYTPGEVAREVPGRAVPLAQIDERLAYLVDLQRLVGRIRVEVAPRGLGKTSLLRQAQRNAEARGALTIWVTAGEDVGLIAAIGQEIHRRIDTWRADARKRLRAAIDKLTVTVGVPGVAQVEAEWSAGRHPASQGVRQFEEVVRETAQAARKEHRSGLVIFIDEIQAADQHGLRTLGYAWQHLQSEGADVPAAVFAAGLPNAPEVIGSVVTFSERFAYRPLDRLTDDAAMVALAGPARAMGVRWDDDALQAAVQHAQGYPYTLQLLGDATWTAAGRPDPGGRLTAAHLGLAKAAIRDDLDALFRARWRKATAGEQELMRAMAALGDGPVRRADVARQLGTSSDQISVTRARLIDKGLVDTPARGELEFTVPGFAEFIRGLTDPA
jgi:hypothetical protein